QASADAKQARKHAGQDAKQRKHPEPVDHACSFSMGAEPIRYSRRMLTPPRLLLSAALSLCLLATSTSAFSQARPDDDLARRALTAAEIGQPLPPLRADHPLQGWIGHARLNRDIANVTHAQAMEFLERHRGQAVESTFRAAWLAELAKRKDWPAFRAAW